MYAGQGVIEVGNENLQNSNVKLLHTEAACLLREVGGDEKCSR